MITFLSSDATHEIVEFCRTVLFFEQRLSRTESCALHVHVVNP